MKAFTHPAIAFAVVFQSGCWADRSQQPVRVLRVILFCFIHWGQRGSQALSLRGAQCRGGAESSGVNRHHCREAQTGVLWGKLMTPGEGGGGADLEECEAGPLPGGDMWARPCHIEGAGTLLPFCYLAGPPSFQVLEAGLRPC